MRFFFKLSILMCLFLNSANGSTELNIDVKIISEGQHIRRVYDHDAEPRTVEYFNLRLPFERGVLKYYPSVYGMKDEVTKLIIADLQRSDRIHTDSPLRCSSVRFIRKATQDTDPDCERLFHAPLVEVLAQLDIIATLALEVRLVQAFDV